MDRIYGLKKPSFKRDKGVRPGEQEPSIDARRKQYRAAKENLDRHFDFLSLVRELNQLKLLLASTDQAKQSLSDREVALHLLQQEPDLPKPQDGKGSYKTTGRFKTKSRLIQELSVNESRSELCKNNQDQTKPTSEEALPHLSQRGPATNLAPPAFEFWDEKSIDPLHPHSTNQTKQLQVSEPRVARHLS